MWLVQLWYEIGRETVSHFPLCVIEPITRMRRRLGVLISGVRLPLDNTSL